MFKDKFNDYSFYSLKDLPLDSYTTVMTVDSTHISTKFFHCAKYESYYKLDELNSKNELENKYSSDAYRHYEPIPDMNFPYIVCNNGGFGTYNGSNFYLFNNSAPFYELHMDTQYTSNSFRKNASDNLMFSSISRYSEWGFDCNDTVIYLNDYDLYQTLFDTGNYQDMLQPTNLNEHKPKLCYVPNLFAELTQVIGGYGGPVFNNDLEKILDVNGQSCDNSILDDYKYKIYYMLNNASRMVFLNNSDKPNVTKTDYDGTCENSCKYTVSYNKTSDCIVYFPIYNKYISFDDWQEMQPKDNYLTIHHYDNNGFELLSDWNVKFDENKNPSYTGTRVILSWDSQVGENADLFSISDLNMDKESLMNAGWKEGRPSDTNYPYCVEMLVNTEPAFRLYFNAKPKVVVVRSNVIKCEYQINMLSTYGYMYSVANDMYVSYDFTVNAGKGNFVNEALYKYLVYSWHALDDDMMLTLYDNWRGTPEDYIGTRIFFNWDITADLINNDENDDYDYSQNVDEDIGEYTDKNGNQHGGNINDYSSDDLNKFNDNNGNDDIQGGSAGGGSAGNSDFDFSFNGIYEYCGNFFNFLENVFGLMPAWLWLIIATGLATCVVLRVLGR